MLDVNEVLINGIDFSSLKNKIYFNRRKQLKSLMKSINSYIDFNSQTYFLALYYMDLIFTHKDLEKIFFSHFSLWHQYPIQNIDLQMSNYVLLSLACLIIAAKFNENDSNIPTMSSFLRLLYEFSKKKYIFSLDNLFLAEVVVLKILKYKLNYYTIYHYLIFFFTHGIVLKKTIERSKIYKKISERKILEKVYIKVREIFDEIIESEKYYEYYFGQKNYEIVVLILLWCTEHILGEEIKDNENIFKLIFGINIQPNKKKEIYQIIEQIHSKIKKRNALNNSTRLIELSNNKKVNNDILNQKSYIHSSQVKSISQDYNYFNNYNMQQKSSITSSTFYTSNQNQYNIFPTTNPYTINNDYFNQFDNRSIQKEAINNNYNINKYLYNYSKESKVPLNNNKLNEQLNQTSNIKYGPNKRIYLTTYKENASNSKFNVNSIEKMNLKNKSDGILVNNNKIEINKRFNSNRNVKVLPFQIEKAQSDNKRQLNENRRKIILINKYNNYEPKMRKKSLSCSKDIEGNIYEYHHPRQHTNINSNNNKMKIEEKIKSTTIANLSNSIELNNYYFSYRQNDQSLEKPLNKKEKDKNQSEYKKYLLARNHLQKKSLNNSYMVNNGNADKKIVKDNIINRTKYYDKNKNNINNNVREYNANIELEPQDNYARKSVTKSFINNINKNIDIDDNYNKANTIIINNNIQINTLINDKSKNLYLVNKDVIGENKGNYENKYRNKKFK